MSLISRTGQQLSQSPRGCGLYTICDPAVGVERDNGGELEEFSLCFGLDS